MASNEHHPPTPFEAESRRARAPTSAHSPSALSTKNRSSLYGLCALYLSIYVSSCCSALALDSKAGRSSAGSFIHSPFLPRTLCDPRVVAFDSVAIHHQRTVSYREVRQCVSACELIDMEMIGPCAGHCFCRTH